MRIFGDKTLKVYCAISSKKLTAANSHFFDGVAFYIVKKDENDKACGLYASYLYPSGVLITSNHDKEVLKKELESGIESIKKFIKDYGIKEFK